MSSARPSLVKATTQVISSPAEVVSGILLQCRLQRILYSKQGAFKDGLLPEKKSVEPSKKYVFIWIICTEKVSFDL